MGVFVFIYTISVSCQTDSRYNFLNNILPDMLEINPTDTILLRTKTVDLRTIANDRHSFFSKEFFKDYMYPVLGTDSEKVRDLIEEIDLEYLSNSKNTIHNWNIKQLHYHIIAFDKNLKDQLSDSNLTYEISEPVFNENKTVAFVYYSYTCGMDCGQGTVKVYKFADGKWTFFVRFPIWIS